MSTDASSSEDVMVRINFEADDEFRSRLEWLMTAEGCSTQKQLMERAISILTRRHEVTHVLGRAVVALPIEQLRDARNNLDVMLLDMPPAKQRWLWLGERPGWRATPWIKGTRLHVSDVMGMIDERPDIAPEALADELQVTPAAVHECFDYIAENRALIEAEEREALLRISGEGDDEAAPR